MVEEDIEKEKLILKEIKNKYNQIAKINDFELVPKSTMADIMGRCYWLGDQLVEVRKSRDYWKNNFRELKEDREGKEQRKKERLFKNGQSKKNT
jgi:hypothetical protein